MFAKLLALAFLILAGPAIAQQPIVTDPAKRNADPSASSTIAVTNTFQVIWAANTNRSGCTVQNNGSNTMWVYFVPPSGTAATKGASVVLAAGGSVICSVFGVNLTNGVQITGSATDPFYAAAW